MPQISLIVPAYNIKDYLSACLDSCLAQDFKENYEIIIVDDGSTDGTAEICDTYAKKSEKITVVHQKNSGLSAARNIGIKKAKGNYVALIDGDDCIAKTFLSHLYQAIKDTDSEIAICDFTEFENTLPSTPKAKNPAVTSGQSATIRLLTGQENRDIIACNKLYQKSLFKNIQYPIGKLHEDNLTTYKLFAAAVKVASINESLYFYRQRSGSITAEQDLLSRLQTKEHAAKEAIAYFKHDQNLKNAADIALLLSKFAYLDNLAAGRLHNPSLWTKTVQEIKAKQKSYRQNPYLTKKLRLYLWLLNLPGAYKIFRRLIH